MSEYSVVFQQQDGKFQNKIELGKRFLAICIITQQQKGIKLLTVGMNSGLKSS